MKDEFKLAKELLMKKEETTDDDDETDDPKEIVENTKYNQHIPDDD